jgi:hypothetical protein
LNPTPIPVQAWASWVWRMTETSPCNREKYHRNRDKRVASLRLRPLPPSVSKQWVGLAQIFAGDASMNSRRGTPRGKQNTVNLRRVTGADDHGRLFTANGLNGGLAVPWPH